MNGTGLNDISTVTGTLESLYPMECWPRDRKLFHDTQWVKVKNDTPLFATFSWKYISLKHMSSVTWVALYKDYVRIKFTTI